MGDNQALIVEDSKQTSADMMPRVQYRSIRRRRPTKIYKNYNSAASKGLGVTQILLAGLAILINSVGVGVQQIYQKRCDSMYYEGRIVNWNRNDMYLVMAGIWGAVFVMMSGAFSLVAGVKKTRCWVVTGLVFAMIGILFAVVMTGFSSAALGVDLDRFDRLKSSGYVPRQSDKYHDYDDDSNSVWKGEPAETTGCSNWSRERWFGDPFTPVLTCVLISGAFVLVSLITAICCICNVVIGFKAIVQTPVVAEGDRNPPTEEQLTVCTEQPGMTPVELPKMSETSCSCNSSCCTFQYNWSVSQCVCGNQQY